MYCHFSELHRGPPGFRIQRNKTSNVFQLQVATSTEFWSLCLTQLPLHWTYITFTWSVKDGLSVYFNGHLMSKRTNGTTVNNPEPLSRNDATRLHIGKDEKIDYLEYGKFQIGHLAIWTTMMSQANVRKVYRDFTKIAPSEKCNEIKGINFQTRLAFKWSFNAINFVYLNLKV